MSIYKNLLFGRKVKEYRQLKGITQEALGKKLGCLPSRISELENGDSKRLELITVLRICNAFGIKFDELVG
jgi:transcriptional regulator with XRE-family HTH domain